MKLALQLEQQKLEADKERKIIGDGSYIGKNVYFDLFDVVKIGQNCAISAGVKFITHSNPEDRFLQNIYPREQRPIVVGDGAWIGANTIVLNGITVGKNCVVGAGAVLTKSFPDYSLIVGVPGRLVRTLQ